MSETPTDKTSRKIAKILSDHCFEWQATVYLSDETDETNHQQTLKCKRLIQKDNPDIYILSFITYSTNKEDGEQQPFICFYSWDNLIGTSLKNAQDSEGFRVAGEQARRPKRKLISRRLNVDQIEGTIRRIRNEKVFDLSMFFGDKKLRRYSFINKAKRPSESGLTAIQEAYNSRKESWYERRRSR